MTRFPDDEIERIKREVDLVRLIEESGVALKRVGHELLGRCVFHTPDTTPSLSVNPDKGVWRCFACGVGGSCFDWIMKRDKVSFAHAKAILRTHLGDGAAVLVVSRKVSRELPQVLKPTAEDRERLKWVVQKYHELLLTGATPATAYLQKRGILDDEAVRTFKLGYADRTLCYGLPPKSRTREDDPRRLLERIGILRESGHEHFVGSLVIPVIDAAEDVREVYGRKVRDDLRVGTPKHLFLDSGKRVCPNRGVWNWQGIEDQDEVILCEALIDALTFWCAGFRNVTASYGCDVFPEQHAQAFKRCGVRRVLIAFDRDEAGDRGAAAVAAKLGALRIGCFRVHFPHRMDANEYALKLTPAAKSLGLVLQNATWMGQGPPPSRSMEVPAMPSPTETSTPADQVQFEAVDPLPTPVEQRWAAEGGDDASIADETQVALEGEAHIPEGREATAIDEPAIPSPLSAALPVAAAPTVKTDVVANVTAEEITIDVSGRRYRIRGLGKNMSYDLLKVNILVSRGDAFHVDTFDLYASRFRQMFVRQAAQELGLKEDVIKKDLGRVLLALEALQDEQIKKSLAPQVKPVVLTEEERSAALARLKSPNLLNELADDLELLGLVGELVNKKVCLLAAVSRKQPRPLAIMVQSSSASGKSTLMDRILAVMPDEDCIQYSAMTGQSLFYMGEKDLKHKILAIAEEEGASRASYALKLLQSEGQVSIASTGKDPATGRLLTHEYQVKGPVMLFLTTTAVELDEELLNRCIVLSVDEGRAQTRAIHRLQRHQETIEGIIAEEEREELRKLHQNMQRLLQPVKVHNPFAPYLTFLDKETQTRRDNPKYLGLIRAVALLNQYQRPRKTMVHKGRRIEYIDVTLEDVAIANELANEVLGQSLKDLPEQTEQLLYLIERMVAESCEAQEMERKDYLFSRRDIREHVGWKDGRLKKHLKKLEELEYLVIHRAGSRFLYELVYDGRGKDGARFLPGLLDVEELRATVYDPNRSRGNGHRARSEEQKSRAGHPEVTGVARGWHGGSIGLKPVNGNGSRGSEAGNAENALGGQTIESSQLPPGRNGDELDEAV